jgi:pimeloyl-ACP methyl ester carboxylesterase
MSHEITYPTIRGTRIRMFGSGEGAAVLFLHGGAGLSVWTPFFQQLAKGHRLIVPEHPGFGQSDNPDWLKSVSDLALFYLDLIDEMGLGQVHLVGNSFGGWIAAELAVRDAARLKTLTLIGPSGLTPPAADIFRWSHEESTRNLFHNQAIAERLLSQPPSLEQLAGQLKNQTTVARLGGDPCLYNPDLKRWLHRIKLPVHIVWGAQDRLSPPATAAAWADELADATVTIIPEAGHLPHAEKVDLTGPAVSGFLANRG